MIVAGKGIFCRYSSGTSKNGYAYKLAEFKSEDYEKCTVEVVDDIVPQVTSLKDGDPVHVIISISSGFRGLTGKLISVEKK